MKRWAKRLGAVIGALLLLALVLFLVAQTGWAKRRLAAYIETALGKATKSDVVIGRLKGTLPFTVVLEQVTFTDSDGTWLTLRDLKVRWAPFALIRGRIHVHEVSSSALQLERLPPALLEPKTPKPPRRPWQEMIPSLVVEELAIQELTLGAPVLGERAVLAIEGSVAASRSSKTLAASWRVERSDAPGGRAELTLALRGTPSTLALHAEVEEPEGGILAALVGMPDAGSISAAVHGEGPLASWKGKLDTRADHFGALEADLGAALSEEPIDLAESNPRLTGRARFDLWEGDKRTRGTSDFALEAGVLSIPALAIEAAGSRITGRLALDIKSGLCRGELQGDIEDLSSLTPLLREEIAGSAWLNAKLEPSDDGQNVVVEAVVKNLASRFGEAGQAQIEARLTNAFASPSGTVRVEVKRFQKDDLAVDTLDLTAEGDPHGVTFACRAIGDHGKPFEIEAGGAAGVGEFLELSTLVGRYGEIPVVLTRPVALRRAEGAYDVEAIELQLGSGRLQASGRFGGEAVAATLDFDGVPVEFLQEAGAPGMDGLASGHAWLTGPTATPEAGLQVLVTDLKLKDPSYADLPAVTLSAEAQLREGRFDAALTVKEKPDEQALQASFSAPVTFSLSPLALSLDSEARLEANLSADVRLDLLSALLLPQEHDLRGHFRADLHAAGTLDAPEVAGSIRLADASYTNTATGTVLDDLGVETSFAFKEGSLSVSSLSLEGAEGTVRGRLVADVGERPWKSALQGRIEGSLSADVRLGELIARILPEEHALRGHLTANLEAAGTMEAPQIAGTVRIEDGSYAHAPTGTVLSPLVVGTEFALKDGSLSLSSLLLEGAGSKVTGRITVGTGQRPWEVDPEGRLGGSLSADVQLGEIAALFLPEDHELGGRLAGDLDVSGTAEAPVVAGSIRIEDAAYENVRTGTVLRDLRGEIVSADSRLVLKAVRGTDGENGTVSVEGWLDLAPAKDFPFQLDVALKDATLLRSDDLTGAVGGRVTLAGSFTDMLVTGRLKTGPVNARLPERAVQDITDLNVIEINGPVEAKAPPPRPRAGQPSRMRFDLALELPKRVFVRGHGLDSEWEGKLHIAGDARDPVITGGLVLTRGSFDFADRRFTLTEGSIFFGGAVPPAPVLSIRAEAPAADITAIIQLSGPISAPELAFSSVPTLPSDEILARVLFGQSVSGLTPYQAVRLARVVDALARGGDGFSLLGRARTIMGLDRLELTQSGESLSDASISAGKYISDDVYVEVKKNVAGQGGGVSVEKQVSRRVSIETDVGARGGAGLGLKWKWDY